MFLTEFFGSCIDLHNLMMLETMTTLDGFLYNGLRLREQPLKYNSFHEDVFYKSYPYSGFVEEVADILLDSTKMDSIMYYHSSSFLKRLMEVLGDTSIDDLVDKLNRYSIGFVFNDSERHFDFILGEWTNEVHDNPFYLATSDHNLLFSLRILIESYLQTRRVL